MAQLGSLGRLDCENPLLDSAHVIIAARLDELEEARARIARPEDSEELHEARIAAKRLRYSLEMFTVCFPSELAQQWADEVRAMQDVLGRIHDLDVLHGLLHERINRIELRARDEALEIAMAPADAARREDELLRRAQSDGKSDGRFGLYKVIAAKSDERRQLYDRFVELWNQWEGAGFLATIRGSLKRE